MTRIRFALFFALTAVLVAGALFMAGFHTPTRHAMVELKYQTTPAGGHSTGS